MPPSSFTRTSFSRSSISITGLSANSRPPCASISRDQTREIFERMERRLSRIAQHRRVLEALERDALGLLDFDLGGAERLVFLVLLLARVLEAPCPAPETGTHQAAGSRRRCLCFLTIASMRSTAASWLA